jgi:hypothetical protein
MIQLSRLDRWGPLYARIALGARPPDWAAIAFVYRTLEISVI